MKLNDFIKQRVSEHHEEYNSNVWNSLSSKLDIKEAAHVSKGFSKTSLWVVTSTVLVTLVVCLFYIELKNTEVEKSHIEKTKVTANNSDHTTQNLTPNKSENVTEKQTTVNSATDRIKSETSPKNEGIKTSTYIANSTENNNINKQNNTTNSTTFVSKTTDNNPISPIPNKSKKDILSLDWSSKICKNSGIVLNNSNKETISLVGQRSSYKITSNNSIQSDDLMVGTYQVKNSSGDVIKTIEVVDVPSLDFSSSDMVYDKGLPYIKVKVDNENLDSYNWKLNGRSLNMSDNTAMIPAFNKGDESVSFTGTSNGCPISQKTIVKVPENYNLLAVTAFNVNSKDERNRTFLPYALYDRDVNFEMSIMDSQTGDVIFETKSISQPWNGINNKTGELVDPYKKYIWQVRIYPKADFETKSLYQGLIMRVAE